LLVVLLLGGCCAIRVKRAHIPGCDIATAEVPRGCYANTFPDRVEVRCHDGTTITYYPCKHEVR
jgi:hypothetical protein